MRCAHGRFDDDLLDRLLAALASRGRGTSPAMAVADALIDHFRAGLRACDATPKRSWELLRPWQHFEDRITEDLANEAGTCATAAMRFHAIELVGLVRCITSTEPWAEIEAIDPCRIEEFARWVRNTAQAIGD